MPTPTTRTSQVASLLGPDRPLRAPVRAVCRFDQIIEKVVGLHGVSPRAESRCFLLPIDSMARLKTKIAT
jgi:hypothetical protein